MHSGKSENEIMPSNRLRAYYSINLQWLEACGDSVRHAGNTADCRKDSEKHSGNQNLACLTVINHQSSTKNELGKTVLFFNRLKMETTSSSEKSVTNYQSTRCHILQN